MKKEKYDATYKFGNTTVHVVAPPPMTDEEKNKILDEFHQAGYEIWKNLSVEEKLKC
ncbi:hypothetical protein ACR77J_12345 [Tissierella praeacuta]|uniref:hypothetical protein n=1 Tax=Tissierella praeacuta TaxID=43131 RepID=UPI0010D9CCF3|nr:hypothetical protein [Tissierella praeacuta]TCU72913.1 hypothetical protein EV204_105249 [Tissierella praeacuta]